MRERKIIELVGKYGICYIDRKKKMWKLSPDEIVYRFTDYQFVSYHTATFNGRYGSDSNNDIIELLEEFDSGYFNQTWTINDERYIKKFVKRSEKRK